MTGNVQTRDVHFYFYFPDWQLTVISITVTDKIKCGLLQPPPQKIKRHFSMVRHCVSPGTRLISLNAQKHTHTQTHAHMHTHTGRHMAQHSLNMEFHNCSLNIHRIKLILQTSTCNLMFRHNSRTSYSLKAFVGPILCPFQIFIIHPGIQWSSLVRLIIQKSP